VDIDAYPFQARSCVTTLEELNESMQASYEMKQLPTIASTDILVRMNGYAVGSLIAFERYDGSMYYRVVRAQ
jgi:DNA-directed RNA polymerase subunit H (RpoH/RPB5)